MVADLDLVVSQDVLEGDKELFEEALDVDCDQECHAGKDEVLNCNRDGQRSPTRTNELV